MRTVSKRENANLDKWHPFHAYRGGGGVFGFFVGQKRPEAVSKVGPLGLFPEPQNPCPLWLDDRGAGQWKWMEEVRRRTSLVPLCFVHCLIGVPARGAFRVPGAGGDRFARCNLRPVIFGVRQNPDIPRKKNTKNAFPGPSPNSFKKTQNFSEKGPKIQFK